MLTSNEWISTPKNLKKEKLKRRENKPQKEACCFNRGKSGNRKEGVKKTVHLTSSIMSKSKKTSDRITKNIRWIARILSVPMIVYVLLMFIGYSVNWITTGVADPHAVENYPFVDNLPPIFLFLATIGLGAAWFKEKLGGMINIIFCSAVLMIFLIREPIPQDFRDFVPYIILVIIAFPGILFLTCSWRSQKRKIQH